MYKINLFRFCYASNCKNFRFYSEKNVEAVSATSSAAEMPAVQEELVQPYGKSEVEMEKEKKYERISDISRMKLWHKKLFHNEITPPDEFKWQKERKFLKQRYAKYGKASGVEPGVMWPTRRELREKILEERQWAPQLFETLARVKTKRKEDKEKREAKIKQFEENCKKYRGHLEDFREKLMERQKQIDVANAKKQHQIQEIQDYFGYALDPSDPRFIAMLAKKEQEERKVAKSLKKKEQAEKALEHLQAVSLTLKQKADKESSETEEKS